MRKPTFFEGVAVALGASLLGAVLYAALTMVFPIGVVARDLAGVLGFGYVVYLLVRSRERTGRITTVAAWMIAAGSTWLIDPPFAPFVLVHTGMIWLIRSLYYYSSVLSALADLALNGLSLAAAGWAASQSGSVFLTLWCFFLVQALFVAIPARMSMAHERAAREPEQEDGFERAHRAARTALRRLITSQ